MDDILNTLVSHYVFDCDYDSEIHPDYTADDQGYEDLSDGLSDLGWHHFYYKLSDDKYMVFLKRIIDDQNKISMKVEVVRNMNLNIALIQTFLKALGENEDLIQDGVLQASLNNFESNFTKKV